MSNFRIHLFACMFLTSCFMVIGIVISIVADPYSIDSPIWFVFAISLIVAYTIGIWLTSEWYIQEKYIPQLTQENARLFKESMFIPHDVRPRRMTV